VPRLSPALASRGDGVLGAVLAGGRGERLGGAKATATLHGRPLVAHAIDALRTVAGEVVVVARPDTALPPGLAVAVWRDDADAAERHPRHGLVRALRGASGRVVLALAVDLPFVGEGTLRALLDAVGGPVPPGVEASDRWPGPVGAAGSPDAGAGGRPLCAIARAGGRLQPLCGAYLPDALPALRAAPAGEPLRRTVERLRPLVVDVPAEELANINTAADLAAAERRRSR
jgi:molybdopterin-guanine dinucleotide biosynthesis protein A